MDSQQNQIHRILSMYERLSRGHLLTKKDEADAFGVGSKTIQRDFDSIRAYLEKEKINHFLEYDRKQNVYRLLTKDENFLRNEEIFAIAKILIESRAFPKMDMNHLIDKLTNLAQPDNQPFIKELLLNEKHLYAGLQHNQSLFTLLWKLANAVHTKRIINIRYKREHDQEESGRVLKPVGLMFSEFYFYLIAYQTKQNINYPIIYRVDRIVTCDITEEHFKIPYKDRFQEGEFRKRIQFMYSGELMTVKFRFTGPSPQAVLDRLPTARIADEDKNGIVFEGEVFGHGIKMWLLSQGDTLEVLSPSSFRQEMQESIEKMKMLYDE